MRSAPRRRTLPGVGIHIGSATAVLPRSTTARRAMENAGVDRPLSPDRSCPNSDSPTIRRVSLVISSCRSIWPPARPASRSHSSSMATVALVISVTRLAMASAWNAGAASRRCRFQKSPSLLTRPLPPSRRKLS